MPQIILNSGEVLDVTYNQAAKVYQILQGNKQPEDAEQAEFIETVADVKFPPQPLRPSESSAGNDEDLHNLMSGQYSSGHAKFEAIGKHLKAKRRGV